MKQANQNIKYIIKIERKFIRFTLCFVFMCEIINHNYGSKIGYLKEEFEQESLMYNR